MLFVAAMNFSTSLSTIYMYLYPAIWHVRNIKLIVKISQKHNYQNYQTNKMTQQY